MNPRKLIALVKPFKPVSQMTAGERRALAAQIVGKVADALDVTAERKS
jgi:hypothetical protein